MKFLLNVDAMKIVIVKSIHVKEESIMPTEQFGQSQIKEVKFTKAEIVNLVHENILVRMSTSYDFDYQRPLVIQSADGGLIFRFVQGEITGKEKMREADLSEIQRKR